MQDFFISARTNSKKVYESDSESCIQVSISIYILVMVNVDIYGIVSTIEIYENRTALLQFSVDSNSVQSTVTNNISIQQTVIDLVPMHDAQPQNNTIPILKYPGKFDK